MNREPTTAEKEELLLAPDYFSRAEGRYDFLRLSLKFISCALCRMVVPCFAKSVSDLNDS
jgi:hypothetical protein